MNVVLALQWLASPFDGIELQIRSEYGRKCRKGKKYIAGLLGVKRGLQGLKRREMVGRKTETQRVGHRWNL